MVADAMKDVFEDGVRADCFRCGISVKKEEVKCGVCGEKYSVIEDYWRSKIPKLMEEEQKQIEAKENASKASSSGKKEIDWAHKGKVSKDTHGITPPVFVAFRDIVKPLYDAKHKDWDDGRLGTIEECMFAFFEAYNDEPGEKTRFLDENIRTCDKDEVIKNIIKVIDAHAAK